MKRKLQFAGWLLALAMIAGMAEPLFAQRPGAKAAPNRQANKPPMQQRQQRQQQRHEQKQAQMERRQNENVRRLPGANPNRPGPGAFPNNNPNRPPSNFVPAPRRNFNSLTPQEKQRVLENNRRLQNLPPAQRQELQERARVWGQMSQPQRDHIRNNVLPRWRQMPPDRRQAIQQRLRRLQNMPESARNQRLNDPEFTRGMSEEDRATLRDLSHLHVGGAPEPPNE